MKDQVFNCQRCGHCCEGEGGIIVTLEEQEKIADFLGLSVQKFQQIYLVDSNDKKSIKTKGNLCVFFEPDKGCSIHPVKPKVCAAWPFFRGNLIDEAALEMAKTYCPGINKNVSLKEFRQFGLQYLQQNDLICNLKTGPSALQVWDLIKNNE
ncbi:MAG: YkgJ family cysteine cluster protein [Desulfonauticus sp.]|nr:YkgJ family cysteine cluster protein [Desulfonauticus sp.]